MPMLKRYFVLEMVHRDFSTPMEQDLVEGGWINIFNDEGYDSYESAEKAISEHFAYLLEQHVKEQDYKSPDEINYSLSVKPELVIIEKIGWQ